MYTQKETQSKNPIYIGLYVLGIKIIYPVRTKERAEKILMKFKKTNSFISYIESFHYFGDN